MATYSPIELSGANADKLIPKAAPFTAKGTEFRQYAGIGTLILSPAETNTRLVELLQGQEGLAQSAAQAALNMGILGLPTQGYGRRWDTDKTYETLAKYNRLFRADEQQLNGADGLNHPNSIKRRGKLRQGELLVSQYIYDQVENLNIINLNDVPGIDPTNPINASRPGENTSKIYLLNSQSVLATLVRPEVDIYTSPDVLMPNFREHLSGQLERAAVLDHVLESLSAMVDNGAIDITHLTTLKAIAGNGSIQTILKGLETATITTPGFRLCSGHQIPEALWNDARLGLRALTTGIDETTGKIDYPAQLIALTELVDTYKQTHIAEQLAGKIPALSRKDIGMVEGLRCHPALKIAYNLIDPANEVNLIPTLDPLRRAIVIHDAADLSAVLADNTVLIDRQRERADAKAYENDPSHRALLTYVVDNLDVFTARLSSATPPAMTEGTNHAMQLLAKLKTTEQLERLLEALYDPKINVPPITEPDDKAREIIRNFIRSDSILAINSGKSINSPIDFQPATLAGLESLQNLAIRYDLAKDPDMITAINGYRTRIINNTPALSVYTATGVSNLTTRLGDFIATSRPTGKPDFKDNNLANYLNIFAEDQIAYTPLGEDRERIRVYERTIQEAIAGNLPLVESYVNSAITDRKTVYELLNLAQICANSGVSQVQAVAIRILDKLVGPGGHNETNFNINTRVGGLVLTGLQRDSIDDVLFSLARTLPILDPISSATDPRYMEYVRIAGVVEAEKNRMSQLASERARLWRQNSRQAIDDGVTEFWKYIRTGGNIATMNVLTNVSKGSGYVIKHVVTINGDILRNSTNSLARGGTRVATAGYQALEDLYVGGTDKVGEIASEVGNRSVDFVGGTVVEGGRVLRGSTYFFGRVLNTLRLGSLFVADTTVGRVYRGVGSGGGSLSRYAVRRANTARADMGRNVELTRISRKEDQYDLAQKGFEDALSNEIFDYLIDTGNKRKVITPPIGGGAPSYDLNAIRAQVTTNVDKNNKFSFKRKIRGSAGGSLISSSEIKTAVDKLSIGGIISSQFEKAETPQQLNRLLTLLATINPNTRFSTPADRAEFENTVITQYSRRMTEVHRAKSTRLAGSLEIQDAERIQFGLERSIAELDKLAKTTNPTLVSWVKPGSPTTGAPGSIRQRLIGMNQIVNAVLTPGKGEYFSALAKGSANITGDQLAAAITTIPGASRINVAAETILKAATTPGATPTATPVVNADVQAWLAGRTNVTAAEIAAEIAIPASLAGTALKTLNIPTANLQLKIKDVRETLGLVTPREVRSGTIRKLMDLDDRITRSKLVTGALESISGRSMADGRQIRSVGNTAWTFLAAVPGFGIAARFAGSQLTGNFIDWRKRVLSTSRTLETANIFERIAIQTRTGISPILNTYVRVLPRTALALSTSGFSEAPINALKAAFDIVTNKDLRTHKGALIFGFSAGIASLATSSLIGRAAQNLLSTSLGSPLATSIGRYALQQVTNNTILQGVEAVAISRVKGGADEEKDKARLMTSFSRARAITSGLLATYSLAAPELNKWVEHVKTDLVSLGDQTVGSLMQNPTFVSDLDKVIHVLVPEAAQLSATGEALYKGVADLSKSNDPFGDMGRFVGKEIVEIGNIPVHAALDLGGGVLHSLDSAADGVLQSLGLHHYTGDNVFQDIERSITDNIIHTTTPGQLIPPMPGFPLPTFPGPAISQQNPPIANTTTPPANISAVPTQPGTQPPSNNLTPTTPQPIPTVPTQPGTPANLGGAILPPSPQTNQSPIPQPAVLPNPIVNLGLSADGAHNLFYNTSNHEAYLHDPKASSNNYDPQHGDIAVILDPTKFHFESNGVPTQFEYTSTIIPTAHGNIIATQGMAGQVELEDSEGNIIGIPYHPNGHVFLINELRDPNQYQSLVNLLNNSETNAPASLNAPIPQQPQLNGIHLGTNSVVQTTHPNIIERLHAQRPQSNYWFSDREDRSQVLGSIFNDPNNSMHIAQLAHNSFPGYPDSEKIVAFADFVANRYLNTGGVEHRDIAQLGGLDNAWQDFLKHGYPMNRVNGSRQPTIDKFWMDAVDEQLRGITVSTTQVQNVYLDSHNTPINDPKTIEWLNYLQGHGVDITDPSQLQSAMTDHQNQAEIVLLNSKYTPNSSSTNPYGFIATSNATNSNGNANGMVPTVNLGPIAKDVGIGINNELNVGLGIVGASMSHNNGNNTDTFSVRSQLFNGGQPLFAIPNIPVGIGDALAIPAVGLTFAAVGIGGYLTASVAKGAFNVASGVFRGVANVFTLGAFNRVFKP